MGIAASPSVGCGGAYPGRLVEIQQRRADEEERAEDQVRGGDRGTLAVVALRVQERAERVARDADDHDERGERPERVHVVGEPELAAAGERAAKRVLLDHRRGHREADQREPRDRREDVQRSKRGERQVDEDGEQDKHNDEQEKPIQKQPAQ